MSYNPWIGVAVGGFFGALCRYELSRASLFWGNVPLNIMIINLAGAFLLAVFLEICLERLQLSASLRTGISTGFLGAFTTFSGLCSEAFTLNGSAGTGIAGLYLIISLVGGICAVFAGVSSARLLLIRTGERHG